MGRCFGPVMGGEWDGAGRKNVKSRPARQQKLAEPGGLQMLAAARRLYQCCTVS
jgi:hypothetical protein